MHIPYVSHGHIVKDVQRKCLWGLKIVQTHDIFRFQAIPIYIQLHLYENAMANNYKQYFNTHYQPHCHPITKSLWLCSSVYCGPPHQSRRIWLAAEASNQKGCSSLWMVHKPFDHICPIALNTFDWFLKMTLERFTQKSGHLMNKV